MKFYSQVEPPLRRCGRCQQEPSEFLFYLDKETDRRCNKQATGLRVLYAKFVSVLFGRREHQNLFIQKALVHASVNTSLNYTRINFPYGDNSLSLYIPPWVEQGEPHPLPNMVEKAPPPEEKKEAEDEEKEDAGGLDRKHLPPVIQADKHGGGGGEPYDANRDLESQTDAFDAVHDELLPGEDEDEFEERNAENQREEKRVLLQGETELERQARGGWLAQRITKERCSTFCTMSQEAEERLLPAFRGS